MDSFMICPPDQESFWYPVRDDKQIRHVACMAEQTSTKRFSEVNRGNGATALLNNP
jgi:hypothetical protein